jgi:hypothetical protein
MAKPDAKFLEAYNAYVEAAKAGFSSAATPDQLKKAYDAYVKCANAFWDSVNVKQLKSLPEQENWEHYFAFTQTHSCSHSCWSRSLSCFGSLATIGTYGTLGGCFGTAGTAGTFGTRGG